MAKDKPATEIELEELQELYLKDRDNKEVRDKYFILLKNTKSCSLHYQIHQIYGILNKMKT